MAWVLDFRLRLRDCGEFCVEDSDSHLAGVECGQYRGL